MFQLLINKRMEVSQNAYMMMPVFSRLLVAEAQKRKKKTRAERQKKGAPKDDEEEEAPSKDVIVDVGEYLADEGAMPELMSMEFYKKADFDPLVLKNIIYLSYLTSLEELPNHNSKLRLMESEQIAEHFKEEYINHENSIFSYKDLLDLNRTITRLRAFALYHPKTGINNEILAEFVSKIRKHCNIPVKWPNEKIVSTVADVKFIANVFNNVDFYSDLKPMAQLFQLKCITPNHEIESPNRLHQFNKLDGEMKSLVVTVLEEVLKGLRGDKLTSLINELCHGQALPSRKVYKALKMIVLGANVEVEFAPAVGYIDPEVIDKICDMILKQSTPHAN